MKQLQKFVLPGLVIAIITLIYSLYFSGGEGLGSFSSFDTNNNANKEIRVKVIQSRGIQVDQQNHTASFYAEDKDGVQFLVEAPAPLPGNIETMESVRLTGHLHPDHFHATSVNID